MMNKTEYIRVDKETVRQTDTVSLIVDKIKLKYFQLEEREVVEGWQMDRQTDIISYKAVLLLI